MRWRRERAAYLVLQQHGVLCVPRLLSAGETAAGGGFLTIEYVTKLEPPLSAYEIVSAAGSALQEVHSRTIRPWTGHASLSDEQPVSCATRWERLVPKLRETTGIPAPVLHRLRRWISKFSSSSGALVRSALVHRDFRAANTVVAEGGLRIIDWEMAVWSHPDADVARYLHTECHDARLVEGFLDAYGTRGTERGGEEHLAFFETIFLTEMLLYLATRSPIPAEEESYRRSLMDSLLELIGRFG